MITLEDFIAEETKRLLKFASGWRTMSEKNPSLFPEELPTEMEWNRHFLSSLARELKGDLTLNEKAA